MAPSGPCGSDRPDTSWTSCVSSRFLGAMQYRSQSGPDGLKNWHVTCCMKCGKHRQWALCSVEEKAMAKATLTISSKNYSSWSLRGWLLAKFSGLEFDEIVTAPDDPSAKAEI